MKTRRDSTEVHHPASVSARPAGPSPLPVEWERLQGLAGNDAVRLLVEQATVGERIDGVTGGAALSGRSRRTLEKFLSADLSAVRLHTDAEADSLAEATGSKAFTSGSDIFFRSGAYDPASPDGLRLLAHEAAHVVQQKVGPVAGRDAPGGLAVSDPGDPDELEAERAAHAVEAGRVTEIEHPHGTSAAMGQAVQRYDDDLVGPDKPIDPKQWLGRAEWGFGGPGQPSLVPDLKLDPPLNLGGVEPHGDPFELKLPEGGGPKPDSRRDPWLPKLSDPTAPSGPDFTNPNNSIPPPGWGKDPVTGEFQFAPRPQGPIQPNPWYYEPPAPNAF